MNDFDKLAAELRWPPFLAESAKKADPQAEAFARVAALCVVGLAFLPLRAWLVMVGVGALHGVMLAVPALGYGTTLLVLLGWGMLRGANVSAK
ncbi:hypothetical protein ACFVHB_20110 [Kitasatospora sp. NPDC127111]|uniref:hypothetical protein n=1 Tax=Kitasatospora sp. NPDC127111 TaxID=3345363 RepID=UPI00362D877F